MIVQMKSQCAKEDIEHVIEILDEANTQHFLIELSGIKMIEVFDFSHNLDIDRLKNSPMVERVVKKCTPNLAAKQDSTDETYQITLGEHATFGGKKLGIIAGPCSVETQGHLLEIAHAVSEAGAVALRGGTFKPRTSPYSFQGLGEAGLEMLALAGEETGLPAERVRLIGQLDTYVTRTGFEVVPMVGLVTPPFAIEPDSFEGAEVFEVPLGFFLAPENCERHSRVYQGKERQFYAFGYGDYYGWGATAGMLVTLVEVLNPDPGRIAG